MRRIAIALVVLAGLAPAGAQAATVRGLPYAEKMAAARWPAACSTTPLLEVKDLSFLSDTSDFKGGKPLAAADVANCRIYLDPSVDTWQPVTVCMIIVHEFGHLAHYSDPVGFTRPDGTVDHDHSPVKGTVMYPNGFYQPCADHYNAKAKYAAQRKIHTSDLIYAERELRRSGNIHSRRYWRRQVKVERGRLAHDNAELAQLAAQEAR